MLGEGPPLFLLHGAGAATHSWRDLAPLLSRDFTVVAPDLPGHGFTDTPKSDGLSLSGMVMALHRLLGALDLNPALIVGHSAGAAIGMRLCLERAAPRGLVSLNGALAPFPGAAGHVFPAMARLLFLNPLAIQTFAWRAARPGAVARLIEGTGSKIDAAGLRDYGRLFATTGHVAGALGMMAHWDLAPLVREMPGFSGPLTLVSADNDRAVRPNVARGVAEIVPASRLITLPGMGHLAHEEAPEVVAGIIREAAMGRLSD
jgi:magnesium chelatase accessory protein